MREVWTRGCPGRPAPPQSVLRTGRTTACRVPCFGLTPTSVPAPRTEGDEKEGFEITRVYTRPVWPRTRCRVRPPGVTRLEDVALTLDAVPPVLASATQRAWTEVPRGVEDQSQNPELTTPDLRPSPSYHGTHLGVGPVGGPLPK